MTVPLRSNHDGADNRAQALLACVRHFFVDGIESSWNAEFHSYEAEPMVSRLDTGRAKGYCISLRSKNSLQQLNVAFWGSVSSDGYTVVSFFTKTTIAPHEGNWTRANPRWSNEYSAMVDLMNLGKTIVDYLTDFWDATANGGTYTKSMPGAVKNAF